MITSPTQNTNLEPAKRNTSTKNRMQEVSFISGVQLTTCVSPNSTISPLP